MFMGLSLHSSQTSIALNGDSIFSSTSQLVFPKDVFVGGNGQTESPGLFPATREVVPQRMDRGATPTQHILNKTRPPTANVAVSGAMTEYAHPPRRMTASDTLHRQTAGCPRQRHRHDATEPAVCVEASELLSPVKAAPSVVVRATAKILCEPSPSVTFISTRQGGSCIHPPRRDCAHRSRRDGARD